MSAEKLREFFQQKKSKAGLENVDWAGKQRDWVDAIDRLYAVITEQYLKPIIADGTVEVKRDTRQIDEYQADKYRATVLILMVGDEQVMFLPKGLNIVGATGRIDLQGDMGERTIVRQPGDRWYLVETRTPTLKLVELNEESLLAALKSVMRK